MGIDLKSIKVNKPKANIEDYVFTVYGRPKAGKTSLFAKLVKRIYNDVSKGLLCGFEPGFRALNVLGQEINNWEEFIEIVDQLIEQKDELGIKFVGIDTADKANTMATEYIIQKKKIEDRKPYKVITKSPIV
jgi:GTPase SAR1 family protein